MPRAIMVDTTKCTGCRACQVACKQWNELPAGTTAFTGEYENPVKLLANTWTKVNFNEVSAGGEMRWLFAKTQCMHCVDPACVPVCPSGATHKTELGSIIIDPNRCIGCNYCAANCPFAIPRYDPTDNRAKKCTFCYDRVSNGLAPACVKACLSGALEFGERRDIISKIENRLAKLRASDNRLARAYGIEEMGGMGMIYILNDSPSAYGLPDDPMVPLSARLWGAAFRPVRILFVAAMALGLFVNYSVSKRTKPEGKEGSR